MNEILSKIGSNVISTVIIILLFGAGFVYLFGGSDDTGTQEHIDRVTDNNIQAGTEINRVIENIEHAGDTVTQLESGVNRGKELITDMQRDLDRTKQILGDLIRGDQKGS